VFKEAKMHRYHCSTSRKRKDGDMSDQLNTEEMREHFLNQLDANKRAIRELNEYELGSVAGGLGGETTRQMAASGLITYVVLKATGFWDKRTPVSQAAGKVPVSGGKV
jgi:hypothetical protein